MGNTRISRQSARAKQVWGTTTDGSFFPYHLFPGLVESVRRFADQSSKVVLLGGGDGELGELLHHPNVVNVDLAASPPQRAGTYVCGDMEDPGIYPSLREQGSLLLVAAFSAEYTDVDLTTGNIANTLVSGERFVWLCHHSDSLIVQSHRLRAVMFAIVQQMFNGEVEEATQELLRLLLDLQRYDQSTVSAFRQELAGLTDAIFNFERTRFPQIMAFLSEFYTDNEGPVSASEPLLRKYLRSPDDLAAKVDKRLRPIRGGTQYSGDHPVAIFTAFEKSEVP